MKTIHKYPLSIEGEVPAQIQMPRGAAILSFGNQYEMPTIWALVETDNPLVERRFYVAGTGMLLPPLMSYIGTAQFSGGNLVWHLFEVS